MSLHDQRYLRRTSVASAPIELPAEQKLVPRDERAEPGHSGRIKRTAHGYVPGAKKWYAGYNLKAQEDALAEDFPVGLRNKRAIFVWLLLILSGVATIITTIFAGLIIGSMNFDTAGPQSMVVTSNAVGFLQPVFVAGTAFIQGGTVAIQAIANAALTLSGKTLSLNSISLTATLSAGLQVTPGSVVMEGPQFIISPGQNLTNLATLAPGTTNIGAQQTQILGNLVILNNTQLSVQSCVSEPGQSLAVSSSNNLEVTAFGQLSMTSRFSGVSLTSATNNLTLTAQSPYTPYGGDITLLAAGLIKVTSGVKLPAINPGKSWVLCSCASGQLFGVWGNMTCAEATDPDRCV